MANPSWPGSLPASFQADGYDEAEADVVLRSNMDAGPAKIRRRFTAGVRTVTGVIVVDGTQFAAFQTFYRTTLKNGSLPFDWHEHLPGGSVTAATFRFKEVPKYRAKEGALGYELSLSLEILP